MAGSDGPARTPRGAALDRSGWRSRRARCTPSRARRTPRWPHSEPISRQSHALLTRMSAVRTREPLEQLLRHAILQTWRMEVGLASAVALVIMVVVFAAMWFWCKHSQ